MQQDQLLEQAAQLHQQGLSYRQIEAEIGVSKSTIQRYVKRTVQAEVTPKRLPTYATAGRPAQPLRRSPLRPNPSATPAVETTQKQNQIDAPDSKIAQKLTQLGALANELSHKEQRRAALERELSQKRQDLNHIQQHVNQKRAEWEAIQRDLVDLPTQQRALARQQQQLDFDRQTYNQLLAKTRPQVEAYQTFRIRYSGEWLVELYNDLVQELLDHCYHTQWAAKKLVDFMERRWEICLAVMDFCSRNGLKPASLLLSEGLNLMGDDLLDKRDRTLGFWGVKRVEIHFVESHIERYKSYMVTEIAQPKPFLALPVPLSPFQLIE